MNATFVIPGTPVGKPRQTQRDRWAKRKCVMDYRAWADTARAMIGRTTKYELKGPHRLEVVAHFAIPPSHKKTIAGQYHTVKPDGDNVIKALADALFHNDQMIVDQRIVKRWAGQDGARVEITVTEAV